MQSLIDFFGSIVGSFFTTGDGITLSEVGRVQANTSHKNNDFWSHLSEAALGVIVGKTSVIASGVKHDIPTKEFKLDRKFVETERLQVSEGESQLARLMFALKLFKSFEERLKTAHESELLGSDWVPENLPDSPRRKSLPISLSLERFVDLENLDQLIDAAQGAHQHFSEHFFARAIEVNARAAVLGKILTSKDSFFRAVLKKAPSSLVRESGQGFQVIEYNLVYTDEELKQLESFRQQLSEEYEGLQKETNYYKASIKSRLRDLALEYEKEYQEQVALWSVSSQAESARLAEQTSRAEVKRRELQQELFNLRLKK